MAIIGYTLTYTAPGGSPVTKSFADWNISGVRFRRQSQAPDVVSFSRVENLTQDAGFEYNGKITISRTQDDGTVITKFVGWVDVPQESVNGTQSRRNYKVLGPWKWLEQITFQKIWYRAVDPASPSSSVVGGYRGKFILNFDANNPANTHQNASQQIGEVVAFVNQCAVLQNVNGGQPLMTMGACPTTKPPMADANNITCAEAIKMQLRWMPDAVTKFVYYVDPPQLIVEVPSNTITRDFTDGVVGEAGLTPRHDRQVGRVRIKYEQANSTNGTTWVYDAWDIYPAPPTGTGTFLAPAVGGGYYYLTSGGQIVHNASPPPQPSTVPAPDNQFDELMLTVNLIGWTEQWARAYIQSEAWDTENWLRRKLPFLNAPGSTLRPGWSLVKLTFQDGTVWNGTSPLLGYDIVSGAAVDGLRDGSGNPIVAQTYTALYRVDHVSELGSMKQDKKNDLQAIKFNAISVPTGTYSGLQSQSAGDPIPTGLAQALYEGLATLQHDGSVRFKEANCGESSYIGSKLTLAGGNAAWANMVIQSEEEMLDSGETVLSVGVPRYLSAGDLVELLRVGRNISRFIAPRTVSTGQSSSGPSAAIPQHTHGDNSVQGAGTPAVFDMTNGAMNPSNGSQPANRIESGVDTTLGQFRLVKVGATEDNANGDQIKAGSTVLMRLQDCDGKELKLREATAVNANGDDVTIRLLTSEDNLEFGSGGGPPVWL